MSHLNDADDSPVDTISSEDLPSEIAEYIDAVRLLSEEQFRADDRLQWLLSWSSKNYAWIISATFLGLTLCRLMFWSRFNTETFLSLLSGTNAFQLTYQTALLVSPLLGYLALLYEIGWLIESQKRIPLAIFVTTAVIFSTYDFFVIPDDTATVLILFNVCCLSYAGILCSAP